MLRLLCVVPVLVAFLLLLTVTASAAASPTLSTDKADYSPGEVVHITGEGFLPFMSYALPVKRPDGTIVKGDGYLHRWLGHRNG